MPILAKTTQPPKRFSRRGLLHAGPDQSGATVVAFGLITPAATLILAGIDHFGIAPNNDPDLTDAVRVGARQFAVAGQTRTPTSVGDHRAPDGRGAE